ncbi:MULTISPECIES: L,D-transpeptidase family protein [unclassified Paenibacillus]|uniref:L,D-transpeptidase family protein n=1 Tax=unclassified Paenibacillus TaxID=185978 RepID=UPI0009568DF5|nr:MULTISPECIES: L,D-transpeptidase family protein [unclassified Paenibacillus]ASS68680.1 L,D-transpeptidase family protein [Paenibacillus sp. RUD330]SIR55660.1 L,D-peptidoglycan transpeptidase YkuD, ErfK/YbiS/YcfS/YnhG family [Paenibacillus sp. RU4X]SIR64138.1 L,D-peptidoglycan transpeptidase YkuD, ErfK/YbiS/YcfS/YnhG family [Paenibacillus sp. RU4T]
MSKKPFLWVAACCIGISLLGGGRAAARNAQWQAQADEQGSLQVVVVAAASSGFKAKLSLWEKQGGRWIRTLGEAPAVIGREGMGKQKEGDGKTPEGLFKLGKAFGSSVKPPGLKMPYAITDSSDYWIDDPESRDYNRWIRSEGDPSRLWNSFERLKQPLYRYAMVIEYNTHPVVAGKGSAIFLHLWRSSSKPTAGCVAISESTMLKLMGRLDSAREPMIFMSNR